LIGICLDAGPSPYLVLPFMENGSLRSYLKKNGCNLLLIKEIDEDKVCIAIASIKFNNVYYYKF
jgi:serine/threonine protein kinase